MLRCPMCANTDSFEERNRIVDSNGVVGYSLYCSVCGFFLGEYNYGHFELNDDYVEEIVDDEDYIEDLESFDNF